MKNLSQLLHFTSVVKHGSFALAARELSLAPSSVAKSVGRLEQSLDTRLFHRTTRSVHLTAEGQQLYAKCSRLLAEIEALELRDLGSKVEPTGALRIGAPIAYGTRVILPILTDLQRTHPALDIDLRLSDERVDLLADGLDAVIRFGKLDDSSMISRQIDSQELVLCASPAYLALHAPIRRVADLNCHLLVTFRLPTTGRDRPVELIEGGKKVTLSPSSQFHINHGDALAEAALLGAGLAQTPEFMVRQHLERGALVELLPQCRPTSLSVSLVLPGARTRPSRVQALIDALTRD